MKQLQVNDEVICIKNIDSLIKGYTIGKTYKIKYVTGRKITIEGDYQHYSNSFYDEVNEDECIACIWDHFNLLKDIRKKKLKKLKKLFNDGI